MLLRNYDSSCQESCLETSFHQAFTFMAIPVVDFSMEEYTIRKALWNHWILKIGVMGRCRKLGIIIENKVIQKLMLLRNVKNQECALKFVFFNEKKIRKIWIIFDIENWLRMSEIDTFWLLDLERTLIYQKKFCDENVSYRAINLPFDLKVFERILNGIY